VASFEITIEIARPASAVFAYLTDISALPQWQAGAIEAHADSPVRLGTKVREVRTFLGRRLETTLEVTELEPGRLFTLQALSGPVPFQVRHLLEPAATGTRLTVQGEGEPRGLLRLAGPVAARVAERELEESLAALKVILEAG
jgi:uncharacterized protein YndB with AHSA1/START domain